MVLEGKNLPRGKIHLSLGNVTLAQSFAKEQIMNKFNQEKFLSAQCSLGVLEPEQLLFLRLVTLCLLG